MHLQTRCALPSAGPAHTYMHAILAVLSFLPQVPVQPLHCQWSPPLGLLVVSVVVLSSANTARGVEQQQAWREERLAPGAAQPACCSANVPSPGMSCTQPLPVPVLQSVARSPLCLPALLVPAVPAAPVRVPLNSPHFHLPWPTGDQVTPLSRFPSMAPHLHGCGIQTGKMPNSE